MITVRYGSRLLETSPGVFEVADGSPADPGVYVVGTYFGPDLQERTLVGFSWGGIDFTQWGPVYLTKVEGWDDPPNAKGSGDPVPGRHGARRGRLTRAERTVTLEGFCLGSDRDEQFNRMADLAAAGFGDGDESATLTGQVAGRTLTAEAQLQRYAPKVEQQKWGRRYFEWAIQFYCPDPMRYGPRSASATAIRVPTVGITFPVTGDWVFADDPVGGPVVVNNVGNALADATFTLQGPLSGPGVAILETGARVTFDFDIADGDVLTIDTAEGLCSLNGEYRSVSPLSSLLDEMRLPAGAVSTVQPLGTPTGGSPSLSVSYRPAYW